jgi:hypothetical protein
LAWASARWNDVEWVFEHAAPYVSRRLHGVSSGDGIVPKRPQLSALVPAACLEAAGQPPDPAAGFASGAVAPADGLAPATGR